MVSRFCGQAPDLLGKEANGISVSPQHGHQEGTWLSLDPRISEIPGGGVGRAPGLTAALLTQREIGCWVLLGWPHQAC